MELFVWNIFQNIKLYNCEKCHKEKILYKYFNNCLTFWNKNYVTVIFLIENSSNDFIQNITGLNFYLKKINNQNSNDSLFYFELFLNKITTQLPYLNEFEDNGFINLPVIENTDNDNLSCLKYIIPILNDDTDRFHYLTSDNNFAVYDIFLCVQAEYLDEITILCDISISRNEKYLNNNDNFIFIKKISINRNDASSHLSLKFDDLFFLMENFDINFIKTGFTRNERFVIKNPYLNRLIKLSMFLNNDNIMKDEFNIIERCCWGEIRPYSVAFYDGNEKVLKISNARLVLEASDNIEKSIISIETKIEFKFSNENIIMRNLVVCKPDGVLKMGVYLYLKPFLYIQSSDDYKLTNNNDIFSHYDRKSNEICIYLSQFCDHGIEQILTDGKDFNLNYLPTLKSIGQTRKSRLDVYLYLNNLQLVRIYIL